MQRSWLDVRPIVAVLAVASAGCHTYRAGRPAAPQQAVRVRQVVAEANPPRTVRGGLAAVSLTPERRVMVRERVYARVRRVE
jgi:gamma-glutamyl:cysteine ligase YbdK (ATP-grasp superfamily)